MIHNLTGFRTLDVSHYEHIREQYVEKGYNLVEIDFKVVRSKLEILQLFSSQLKFPNYFGNNWDALWDCIKDLEWLKTKNVAVLIKENSTSIHKQEYDILLDLLKGASKYWREYGTDFATTIFRQKS